MVIVVNSSKRTVTVFHTRTNIMMLTENEILETGDVIPGWTMPVKEILNKTKRIAFLSSKRYMHRFM